MKLQVIFLVASSLSAVVSAINGKVDTVHNPNYNPHGSSLYLKALLKYGGDPLGKYPGALSLEELVPHVLHQRSAKRLRALAAASNSSGNGLDPNLPEIDDQFYLTPTTIGEGTTAQTLNLLFDTGSSDLWVFSILLSSDQGTNNHTLYNAGKTPTSKIVAGAEWGIMYLDGSGASGLVYTDTVNLGGLQIKNVVVEAANQTTSEFINLPGDGLVGLGLQQDTIVPNALLTTTSLVASDSSIFQEPVFTALLTRASEAPGFYTFGYVNNSVVAGGNVSFTDVLSDPSLFSAGAWTFNSSFAIVNGKKFDRTDYTAIIDSGTTAILTETNIVNAVYAGIPGAIFSSVDQAWLIPGNITTFPTVVLPVGKTQITLQNSADFNIGPAGDPAHPNFVIGSIQDNGGIGFDIYGTPFMNNVYVVFDLGLTGANKTRIGVVQRPPALVIS